MMRVWKDKKKAKQRKIETNQNNNNSKRKKGKLGDIWFKFLFSFPGPSVSPYNL